MKLSLSHHLIASLSLEFYLFQIFPILSSKITAPLLLPRSAAACSNPGENRRLLRCLPSLVAFLLPSPSLACFRRRTAMEDRRRCCSVLAVASGAWPSAAPPCPQTDSGRSALRLRVSGSSGQGGAAAFARLFRRLRHLAPATSRVALCRRLCQPSVEAPTATTPLSHLVTRTHRRQNEKNPPDKKKDLIFVMGVLFSEILIKAMRLFSF